MPKGIVIVGPGSTALDVQSGASGFSRTKHASLASLEILGASVVSRVVEDLKRAGVESVAVISDGSLRSGDAMEMAENGWDRAVQRLIQQADDGTDAVLFMRIGPYAELDYADALQAHRDSRQPVTRAFDERSPLDIWIVDPTRMIDGASQRDTVVNVLMSDEVGRYEANGYVNRLAHPQDLRSLVVDSLNSRCRMRPLGFEARPGLWMAEGAEVEKEARIVAPAYIGRQAVVSQQCLITRGSNIECKSLVDYGTVIEDSTVLPNSYVGIGLDVSHSIVDGDKLLNLQHGVVVTIEDSAVMRKNKPLAEAECPWWSSFENREAALSGADKGVN